MAESAVAAFIEAPSLELLVGLRKADLCMLADRYQVAVRKQARKTELFEAVQTALIEQGVLTVEVDEEEEVEGEEEVDEEEKVTPPPLSEVPLRDSLAEEGALRTLPRFDPASPTSPVSTPVDRARLALHLACLQAEQLDREHARKVELQARQHEFELEIQRIKADQAVRIRRMELDAGLDAVPPPCGVQGHFEVSKNIALVPPFREAEVDSYFSAFKRVATALKWPKEVWPLLLQSRLSGKAQEVVASLSLEDSLSYDTVKAYELVPEAY